MTKQASPDIRDQTVQCCPRVDLENGKNSDDRLGRRPVGYTKLLTGLDSVGLNPVVTTARRQSVAAGGSRGFAYLTAGVSTELS